MHEAHAQRYRDSLGQYAALALLALVFLPGVAGAEVRIEVNGVPLPSGALYVSGLRAEPDITFTSGIFSNVRATAESGGSASGMSGDSSASVEVLNSMRSEGANTRVDIRMRTEANGDAQATSVSRTLQRGEPFEFIAGSSDSVYVESEVFVETEATTEESARSEFRLEALFEGFAEAIQRMTSLLFFFW